MCEDIRWELRINEDDEERNYRELMIWDLKVIYEIRDWWDSQVEYMFKE